MKWNKEKNRDERNKINKKVHENTTPQRNENHQHIQTKMRKKEWWSTTHRWERKKNETVNLRYKWVNLHIGE